VNISKEEECLSIFPPNPDSFTLTFVCWLPVTGLYKYRPHIALGSFVSESLFWNAVFILHLSCLVHIFPHFWYCFPVSFVCVTHFSLNHLRVSCGCIPSIYTASPHLS
jgi:hypothetical protein